MEEIMERVRWSRLLTALVSLVVICAPVAALSQAGASWSPHGSMPYERAEMAIATLNGRIYLISGGSRGVEANAFNQEYDPAAGTWRELALMPSVASHAGAAALNGKIYVVGGFVANVHVGAVARVFEYDPATDRWRALAPLAAPRGSPGVVAVNGRIHAIGGRDPERRTVTTHEVYDPATNTWSMAAPLPLARDHLGIAVVAGRIHVFGGRTEATVNNTTRHDVYDPATNAWSTAAPLITARSAGVVFSLAGRIVYAGGECKDAQASVTFSEVEAYDPRTNQWTALPALAPGRHAAAAAAVGEQAYLFGGNLGCGGNRPSKEVLTFRIRN
jgi:N-acetylneuraminic acid mutarotase